MRYGIALTGERVAPRCIFAEAVLVVELSNNRTRSDGKRRLEGPGLLNLAEVLAESRVDGLICGGISSEEREFLETRRITAFDNVAGTVQEILEALQGGALRGVREATAASTAAASAPTPSVSAENGEMNSERTVATPAFVDCIACEHKLCERGDGCPFAGLLAALPVVAEPEAARIAEVAWRIAGCQRPVLSRLSELTRFCVEMGYERVGIAYCLEMQESAEVLARVLRRFVKVYPVCCKVPGEGAPDGLAAPVDSAGPRGGGSAPCNPQGQAEMLNRLKSELNVLVGLCTGMDCIFTRCSSAPATTLFVKDRALANNPVGAVHSAHQLKEAIRVASAATRQE